MRRPRVLAATAAVIALTGFAACGDDDGGDEDSSAENTPAATQPSGGPATSVEAPPATGGTASGDEEAAVKKAVDAYNAAFASADYDGMCGLMSSSARDSFLEEAKKSGVDEDCPGSLDKALGQVSEQLEAGREALRDAEVTEVKIDGDKAAVSLTFTISGQKTTRPYSAVKEDGEWKVAQDPAG